MWYYRQTEPGLWTVGHGEGNNWETDSDHDSKGAARDRVAELNGMGCQQQLLDAQKALEVIKRFNRLRNDVDAYLFEVANFGLGVRETMPELGDFGLEDVSG